MNILFAGTPEFAAICLKSIINSSHDVRLVLTQPDRKKGRGRKKTYSEVKQIAINEHIKCLQPEKLTNTLAESIASEHQVDVAVVVAYGMILPKYFLDLPKNGSVNIHASLLPRWRGAAPIQRAIQSGDRESGITIIKMDEGLDTGDIMASKSIAINQDDTSARLHDKLADLGAQLIVETLNDLPNQLSNASPQDSSTATYAKKLTMQESRINWNLQAKKILCFTRAMNSWPMARTVHNNNELKIIQTKIANFQVEGKPGEIICATKKLIVQAQDAQVQLCQLQKPGGKVLSDIEFLNGYNISPGDTLS